MNNDINIFFDNIIYYLQRSGGGSVYWDEITKHFRHHDSSFFINQNLFSENILFKENNYKNVLLEKKIPLNLIRYLPLTLKIPSGSIFHSSYYRYCSQKSVKNIVTVHDFVHEKFSKGLSQFINHNQKALSIKNSKGIICISETTRNDLYEFFPHLIKGKKIEVIYNGVSNVFSPISDIYSKVEYFKKFNLNSYTNYILYIGHRTNYKNFALTVEIIKDLPQDFKLLIVGNKLNDFDNNLLKNNISDKYIFLGNIDNRELNFIYNIAHCLLYPSSYEGFGIPVIEAFKASCPVVAQKIPVLEEITNNAASLVQGLDKKMFIYNILQFKDSSIRKDYISKGIEQSKKFSWEKCSKEVINFYENL
jgi:mannosyltransferase